MLGAPQEIAGLSTWAAKLAFNYLAPNKKKVWSVGIISNYKQV